MAKPNKSSTPSTHLSQYCNNSFENMRHDCFGDMSFVEEKLQMYTNQFESRAKFSAKLDTLGVGGVSGICIPLRFGFSRDDWEKM
ncbi:hypothetical protein YC2023_031761 [Brassica napus]